MIRINTLCLLFVANTRTYRQRSFLFYSRQHTSRSLFTTHNPDYTTAGQQLDVNLITAQPNLIRDQLRKRNADTNFQPKMERINNLKSKRVKLLTDGDLAKGIRKKISREIGECLKKNSSTNIDHLKAAVDENSAIASAVDADLLTVESELNELFSQFPNLLDDSVPEGFDDTCNVEVYRWGDHLRKVGEGYLWHDDIAKSLNGLENEAAARISGSRFSVLVGSVARLERALTQYFMDFHTNRGYTEVSVPYVVSRSCLEGTGQLPKFEEDLFRLSADTKVAGEEAFLIPTGEVPVTNLFRGQILSEAQLPISLVTLSPCFRAEAGSNGRDTRGLLRQHQFHKVELVKICSPETSNEEHEKLTSDVECVLQALMLPYRKMLLCGGDTGFSARKCYDLEVWMPGQQAFREVSSCSNCHDFQARRMGLRYRETAYGIMGDSKSKKPVRFPHTLNGSGLAVGRILAAILENFHQPDGTVFVPEELRCYMNNNHNHLQINKQMFGTGNVKVKQTNHEQ